MRLTTITVAVLTALTLSACGKSAGTPGVGATSESSQGVKADTKSGIDRSSDLTAGRTNKITFEADFAPLVSDAITDALPATGINAAKFFRALYHGNLARPHVLHGADDELKTLGFGAETGEISEKMKAAATAENDRLTGLIGANDARDRVIGEKLKCVQATLSGDYVKARSCYQEYLPHTYTLHILHALGVPQKGHELDERVIKSRGNERHFPTAGQLETLTYGLSNSARFGGAIEKRLADTLTANTFKEADGAKRVIEALFAIPAEDLIKAATSTAVPDGATYAVANGEMGSELTITVVELGATFAQNEKGVIETRGGATYFGDGYINRVKVKVAMERSVDAKLSTKRTEGSSVSVDNSSSDKTDASISTK